MMEAAISKIAGIIELPDQLCLQLLREFRWNQERLTDKYLDLGKKKILVEYGLDTMLESPTVPNGTILECKICRDDVKIKSSFALGCNHWFCNTCWTTYLKDKVDSTGTRCIMATCPMYDCHARLPSSVFTKFLPRQLVDKANRASINSFVSENKNLRFCPAPRCSKVLSANGQARTVRCLCGQSFCFRCNEEAHEPVTCEQVTLWQAKCEKESETAQWIISNTKKCPKCLVRIEKNQGCNHMSCQFCKYEFCWVCMGAWSDHGNHTGGFYKCNKYDPHKSKSTDDSKAELDRFLHYYQRYHNHDQARKFAKAQIESAEKRMAELHKKGENNTRWQNVQFLRKSTLLVLECRRVLKYTYVFGYVCTDKRERELFEFLQEDLEKATERLSELSEQPLEFLKRQQVVDYTMFTEKFLNNLLNGLKDGLTVVSPKSVHGHD
uniref:RBR-type E3 ubiquitin transferase n=1 Tax=Amorphochlora amoebiformis TaxID=1561963 RepID=A0A7S0DQZ1_9EUKA